jgi:phosphoribosylanthranilate isomerase
VEVAALGPDWIQLHGPETPHRVEAIKQEAGVSIMKALPIAQADDLEQAKAFADVADRLLFDAKPPKGADRPGGNGAPFDWSLLEGLSIEQGFMLSGGLTPDNVAEAIGRVRPMGIDVSTGVESTLGVKDAGLIRRFIANARAAG